MAAGTTLNWSPTAAAPSYTGHYCPPCTGVHAWSRLGAWIARAALGQIQPTKEALDTLEATRNTPPVAPSPPPAAPPSAPPLGPAPAMGPKAFPQGPQNAAVMIRRGKVYPLLAPSMMVVGPAPSSGGSSGPLLVAPSGSLSVTPAAPVSVAPVRRLPTGRNIVLTPAAVTSAPPSSPQGQSTPTVDLVPQADGGGAAAVPLQGPSKLLDMVEHIRDLGNDPRFWWFAAGVLATGIASGSGRKS